MGDDHRHGEAGRPVDEGQLATELAELGDADFGRPNDGIVLGGVPEAYLEQVGGDGCRGGGYGDSVDLVHGHVALQCQLHLEPACVGLRG